MVVGPAVAAVEVEVNEAALGLHLGDDGRVGIDYVLHRAGELVFGALRLGRLLATPALGPSCRCDRAGRRSGYR